MSKIGKIPVTIPNGVTVNVADKAVSVKGQKGALSYIIGAGVTVEIKDGKVIVNGSKSSYQNGANYGTTRAIIANMVKGVTEGWKKELEMEGVGFGAQLSGKQIELSTDFTHKTKLTIPTGIKCLVDKTKITVEGADKQEVGRFANVIKKVWPKEPYLGKGINVVGDYVRRKAGKTGKK